MPNTDANEGFLEGCREFFVKGNKWALMQAIYACASSGRALPKWAAEAYMQAFEEVRTAKVKSWDDVFGKTWQKHHKAVNRRVTTMWPLFNEVRGMKAHKPSLAIDEDLFEEVGKLFGIGKTLASEYYYEAKALNDQVMTGKLPRTRGKSRKYKKRP